MLVCLYACPPKNAEIALSPKHESFLLHKKNEDHFSVVVQIKKKLLTSSKNMMISVFVSTDDVLKVD